MLNDVSNPKKSSCRNERLRFVIFKGALSIPMALRLPTDSSSLWPTLAYSSALLSYIYIPSVSMEHPFVVPVVEQKAHQSKERG